MDVSLNDGKSCSIYTENFSLVMIRANSDREYRVTDSALAYLPQWEMTGKWWIILQSLCGKFLPGYNSANGHIDQYW